MKLKIIKAYLPLNRSSSNDIEVGSSIPSGFEDDDVMLTDQFSHLGSMWIRNINVNVLDGTLNPITMLKKNGHIMNN